MALSHIGFTALYLFCFFVAVMVCGFYGMDLHSDGLVDSPAKSKWIYAVVIGSLSALTCISYAVPCRLRAASLMAAVWNFILFFLWLALFGIFGKMFIPEHGGERFYNSSRDSRDDVDRMRNVVWLDLAGTSLWLVAAIAASSYWSESRRTRSGSIGGVST